MINFTMKSCKSSNEAMVFILNFNAGSLYIVSPSQKPKGSAFSRFGAIISYNILNQCWTEVCRS